MTDPAPDAGDAERQVAAFARRHGLADLSPDELAEFAAMAERVRSQTASVSRMPAKTDEPAHVFRVPTRR